MRLSDKDLVKKLLTSNQNIWLLVNIFLTKSLKMDTLLSFFQGICFKLHTNLTGYIQKNPFKSYLNRGVLTSICHFNPLKSCDSPPCEWRKAVAQW